MIRSYDTSAPFREDCLERNRHLQAGVKVSLRKKEQLEKEVAAREECTKRMKKEM